MPRGKLGGGGAALIEVRLCRLWPPATYAETMAEENELWGYREGEAVEILLRGSWAIATVITAGRGPRRRGLVVRTPDNRSYDVASPTTIRKIPRGAAFLAWLDEEGSP